MDILIEELDQSLWVAGTKNARITGLEVDPADEKIRWGALYWAKVARIDRAMDAAFVNLDGEHIGILHNKDVRLIDSKGNRQKGGDQPIGKILSPGQMIAVQAKNGFLPKSEDENDLPVETKKPRISMDITLQGRYLIHTPMTQDNRLSSRIRDKKRRKQMTKMMDSIEQLNGFILRAAAADTQTSILIREGELLTAMWESLQAHFNGDEPSLIMDGPDAIQRMMSDHAGQTIDRIEVSTTDLYEHTEEWCELFAPDLVTKIHPAETKNPYSELALFDKHDLINQIEMLFQPYVIMPAGGSLIIQKTAALCAIDVNRGQDTRSHLALNIDAAKEIGRQIRLRNIGGIIIIDALKMKKKADIQKVLDAFEDIFEDDPCTVQLHGMTGLGLIEITRNRRTPPLQKRLEIALS